MQKSIFWWRGEQGLNAGEHKGTFLGRRSVLKLDGGDSCTLHTFIKTHQTLYLQ